MNEKGDLHEPEKNIYQIYYQKYKEKTDAYGNGQLWKSIKAKVIAQIDITRQYFL